MSVLLSLLLTTLNGKVIELQCSKCIKETAGKCNTVNYLTMSEKLLVCLHSLFG